MLALAFLPCLHKSERSHEYLDKDESLVMLQKKSGSDVCENHFGNIRAQGAKPSAITAQQLTARGEATLAINPKDTGKMS
jgi:hypothetical protein